MKSILCVYISDDCASCEQAVELAQWVEDSISELDVKVVNVSNPGVEMPPGVSATPSYVLDGKVIHLGNPAREWLFERLS